MHTPLVSALSLFSAYAPEDHKLCVDLDKHLAVLTRLGWIRPWSPHNVQAVQRWTDEMKQHLSTADIILLLISADFLASEYCSSIEMQAALQRHDRGDVIIVPIIMRPVDWSATPFHLLRALPTDGKAVVTWANRDQAFLDITQGLKGLIEQRRMERLSPSEHRLAAQSLWTVPYRQNRFFTGRENVLAQISSAFSAWNSPDTPLMALSGLGGIGKTQIALEYAYRSSHSYHAVFWLNASSQETFLADVVTLADTLDLFPMKSRDPSAMLAAIKRWLECHTRWLLLLDAVSHLSLVTDIIPLRSSGHVLLTTQTPVSRTSAQTLEVDKLVEHEALQLLLQRAGLLRDASSPEQDRAEEIRAAQQICRALDGLPLALDQAGAYVEETGCSLVEYFQRYQQHQLLVLSLRGNGQADHPASVVTTWSLSFEYLEPRDPCAADLLRCCAFLAPEGIPQQIFLQGAHALGPHLVDVLGDEMRFDSAIKTLRQFAFVRRFSQARTLSLHRLVQVVLRSQMAPDVQALWALRVVEALCVTFPHRDDQEWARCALYIPHVFVCETLLEDYHLDYPDAGVLFYRAGRFFHDHAQYTQAEELYRRALRWQETAPLPAESGDLARTLDSLGWLALDQGQFALAEPLFRRARSLKEHIYGETHLETAITLHALGRLAHAQYRYKEAEMLYRHALQIKESTVGPEHAETATTVHTLGWLFYDQGQYDEAQLRYQQALRIRTKALGMQHLSTAITLHELARLAHRQKQYDQAERFYLQSWSIKEQVLGSEHPFIAVVMDALASVYQAQGRMEEAEASYQRALAIREQFFGPEHPFTAESIHHLACLYQEQGQLAQAEILLLQALRIREQALGPDHPMTAISTHQIARLYTTQQRGTEAESFYQRTLAIRERAFGETHPAMQSILQGYARFLRSFQRDTEAQVLEQRLHGKKLGWQS